MLRPVLLLTAFILILAGCSTLTMDHSEMDHSQMDHTEDEAEQQNETQQIERSEGKVVVHLEEKGRYSFNELS